MCIRDRADGAAAGETAGHEALEQGTETVQYEDLDSFSGQTGSGIEWQGTAANSAEGVKAFRWDDVDPSLGKQPSRRSKTPTPPKAPKQPQQLCIRDRSCIGPAFSEFIWLDRFSPPAAHNSGRRL